MDSSPSSEPNRVGRGELTLLRRVVHGDPRTAGLTTVLPLLQTAHRRELRTEPHWSKEELVRHPEPRELIRSMRKAGNLDQQGRPMYTLDERRWLTADIYENRIVRQTFETLEDRLHALVEDPGITISLAASTLLRELEGARRRAPFLDEVGPVGRVGVPSATLTQDPLYRRVMSIRAELAG
ncbi:MAG: DUF2357 domain-containing protein [Actinomycetota bacterium]